MGKEADPTTSSKAETPEDCGCSEDSSFAVVSLYNSWTAEDVDFEFLGSNPAVPIPKIHRNQVTCRFLNFMGQRDQPMIQGETGTLVDLGLAEKDPLFPLKE